MKIPTAEIISTGDELLSGHIINTNAVYISKALSECGIKCLFHTTVGDDENRFAACLQTAISRSDIIITTGGLGPTVDDITVKAISKLTSRPLHLDRAVLQDIRAHFAKKSSGMIKFNIRQAYIPIGSHVIRNYIGTAPGLILNADKRPVESCISDGALIIALPGPPNELMPMVRSTVIPFLRKNYTGNSILLSRTIKTTGWPESKVNAYLEELFRRSSNPSFGIYCSPGQVDIVATAHARSQDAAYRLLEGAQRQVRARIPQIIFGVDDETLEGAVLNLLAKDRMTLSVAESVTGGLIANRLTNIPGASKSFLMGATAYTDRAKMALLGIDASLLKRYTAVSIQVARKMAENIRRISNSSYGLGVVGIAGPTGATRLKPIGLVYIALATRLKTASREFRFTGNRTDIKYRASQAALEMLRQCLIKLPMFISSQ